MTVNERAQWSAGKLFHMLDQLLQRRDDLRDYERANKKRQEETEQEILETKEAIREKLPFYDLDPQIRPAEADTEP